MLLHEHPLNQAREARGELPVNSVWISGIGRASGTPPAVQIDERLGAPLIDGDLAAWAEAFAALDAGPIKALLDAARRGEAVSLTLAGERFARRFEPQARSLAQRLRAWLQGRPGAAHILEAL
jgi:hypothetical protein